MTFMVKNADTPKRSHVRRWSAPRFSPPGSCARYP